MDERTGLPVILRGDAPGEVHRGAGDVGVDVDPAREDDHAARVDRAAALDLGDDPAIRDAHVLEHAVYPVRRIVDPTARYPQHGVSVTPPATDRPLSLALARSPQAVQLFPIPRFQSSEPRC